ncbi:hypothetical protein FRC09_014631 [Ceratobasidium sp. 395]|nr:hypothetical protein FRC09_014631 [Ceratobasidium sp. 395]
MSLVIALVKGILDPIITLGILFGILLWDAGLLVANYVLPSKKVGAVVPQLVHMARKELGQSVRHTYNLAPTLCIQVPWLTAKLLFNGRDWNEQMTLDDLNAHGGIEHDASYTRADVKWQPDQSTPNKDIIKGLYETAGLDINNLKSTDTLQVEDFSNYLAYRRSVEPQNAEFWQKFIQISAFGHILAEPMPFGYS